MTMTEVRERPIPFSGDMVRAILDGRKTQTRRVVRNPERLDGLMLHGEEAEWCPYGRPGDVLWVRERWYPAFKRTATNSGVVFPSFADPHGAPLGHSGEANPGWSPNGRDGNKGGGWRSPIHMPRWASRISLEVVDVRVQRLQEITEADAIAEGAEAGESSLTADMSGTARGDFARIWNELNAKRPGCSWADSPWVWVLSFTTGPRADER